MEIAELQEIIEFVRLRFSDTPGSCLYQSATLAAVINDNSNNIAAIHIGSLAIRSVTIFNYRPLPRDGNSLQLGILGWDGHAWVEVDGYVCDTSIFSTIRQSETPNEIRSAIDAIFSEERQYLIGTQSALRKHEIEYKTEDLLNDQHVTQLFQSGQKLGLIK